MEIKRIKADETLYIRHRVLWPDKPVSFCKLEEDSNGLHYGGYINNSLICVASVFINKNSARLRKFATLPEYQGKGHGTELINFILKDLVKLKVKFFWCDSRETAMGFYKRFGMQSKGDIFYKSNVRYIVMERSIPSP